MAIKLHDCITRNAEGNPRYGALHYVYTKNRADNRPGTWGKHYNGSGKLSEAAAAGAHPTDSYIDDAVLETREETLALDAIATESTGESVKLRKRAPAPKRRKLNARNHRVRMRVNLLG